MTPPGTFERVYAAIKQRLREGAYRPGARLEPASLSDELNASVTPVRDALHRLTGERLVDAPRHEGFRAPMMTETRLRQLYSWHLDLMMLALMKHRAPASIESFVTQEELCKAAIPERLKALFAALVRLTGNPEHLAAFEAVADRLEPVQRLEQTFLDRTETETAEILRAIRTGDRKLLRRSLVQYHRRREKIVPELLSSLLQG
jgi:DNA-binding GntR family transcriptional regulator